MPYHYITCPGRKKTNPVCFDAEADPVGGAPGARAPKIGKNIIFWRKIVIFHTKYPKNVRTSLHN